MTIPLSVFSKSHEAALALPLKAMECEKLRREIQ
jgi:hypothetical protein